MKVNNFKEIGFQVLKMKLERFKIDKIIYGITWLRGYTTKFAVADCIAGITVGLTVLPQSLAYATLAGLEPQVR